MVFKGDLGYSIKMSIFKLCIENMNTTAKVK